MNFFLTDEEIASLTKQHKKERDGRVRDRIKAVLLRDKGRTWMQIAEALLLSEEMLRKHLEDYKISKKLKPENGSSQPSHIYRNRRKRFGLRFNLIAGIYNYEI
ncbi:MAG: hypothetical protein K1060chlam1_00142 [Candidatus Anoxychlamydiales bacterium]|nr:hypothetical protein [Candidatus Anoxychlamydiales bacterium]